MKQFRSRQNVCLWPHILLKARAPFCAPQYG
jgi:hypothetical protein